MAGGRGHACALRRLLRSRARGGGGGARRRGRRAKNRLDRRAAARGGRRLQVVRREEPLDHERGGRAGPGMVQHVDRRQHVRAASAAVRVVEAAGADGGTCVQKGIRRRVWPELRVCPDDRPHLLVIDEPGHPDQVARPVTEPGQVGVHRGAPQEVELRLAPVLERVVALGKQPQVGSPVGGRAERVLPH
eukprot:scaffold1054_cov116-Isochrysis_galbana.AAC.6